jgi:hypothetical protein
MSEAARKITPADILAPAEYDQQRKALKANLIPMKNFLFRELRHHVDAGAGNAAHRERRRGPDRR